MPAKVRPEDWDTLFSPNAPRRGGPLRALANLLALSFGLALLAVGGFYGLRYREQVQQAGIAQATANAQALATSTVVAQQTASARQTAEVPTTAPAPNAEPPLAGIGSGEVRQGGNLRSEPRLVPETVIGLIYPGDKVVFLESQDVQGTPWFRIRITEVAANRGGDGVGPGTEGWASGLLLSPP